MDDGTLNGVPANDFLGAINGIIQSLKRKARGYRNTDNFIAMINIWCGLLEFNFSTRNNEEGDMI